MPQVNQRFDKSPMHRGIGQGPLGDPPHNYEVREVEPDTHDELHRRAGSERQALYGRAPGAYGPGNSKWLINRQGLNMVATATTLAFRVRVGTIQAASGTVPLVTIQRQQNALNGDTFNRLYVWLEKASGVYYIRADVYDNAGSAGLPAPIEQIVSVGDDAQVAIYTNSYAATNTLTLNVGGSTDTDTIGAGTYTMTDCVASLFNGASADGTPTSIDPFNFFNSDVSGDGIADITSRAPTTTPIQQTNFDSTAPIAPATGSGDAIPYPSAPLVDSGTLLFSGYSGALRVPYRPVFDQFFSTQISSVGSQVFAFKVKHTPSFHSADQAVTLVDFPGFVTISLDTSLNPVLTYGDQAAWTTTGLSGTVGVEQTFWIGCDGTNLYIYDASTSDTEPLTGSLPELDYARIPDMIIGAPEDPAGAANYHGTLSELKMYNYAATSDDGTPIFDLDLSGTEPRDASKFRLPIGREPHTTVDDLAMLVPGPVQDENHAAVLSGEVVVGTGTVDSTSDTYLRAEDGAFDSSATSARFGDKVIACQPDGTMAVIDSEQDQTRPFGIPQIQREVTGRSVGTGALEGAYCYGARFLSGDGTYGPVRRFKPLKALEGTAVLLGSSGSGTDEETELGESYGRANKDYKNYFEWDGGVLSADSDSSGFSIETHLRFPEFDGLEEDIFDRGSTLISTSTKETAWPAFASGIPVDFTSDFTIQTAFTFDDTLSASHGLGNSVCIHAIGHNDPAPWTRPYMLVLYKDPGTGWGGGTEYRLAAFRANGRRDLTYQGAVVEDSGIWTNGKRYNVMSIRRGDALEIHVHNQTDDLFYHFTATAAAATASLDMTSFWDGRKNYGHKNKATYLHHGAPALREEGGSSGSMIEEVDQIKTDGDFNDTSQTRINPMAADTTYFHGRAWSRALNKAQFKFDSEKRFAAAGTGPLNQGILSDIAFVSDDPSENPQRFWDRAKSVFWDAYAEDATTSKVSNPAKATFEHDFPAGQETIIHGTYLTDDSETDPKAAEYQLYATSIGDGSIVLSTGAESFTLAGRLWDPNNSNVTKLAGFSPEEFNWYTTSVDVTTDSTEYDLTILDLAINGKEYTDRALAGPSTPTLTKADFRVYLGGFFNVTNDETSEISEFRLWASNRYDDASESYDYLQVRVPAGDRSGLYLYATFQPADENTPADGEFTNRGSLGGTFNKSTDDGGAWDDTNDAEIVDERNNSGDLSDPPPAVAFPTAPYPHITAIEILRSGGIPIVDPDDEAEVARALIAAEGAPLRSLARIPIGTTSYRDILADTSLGAEVADGAGFAPGRVKGVFLWAGRLGVFRDGVIQLSEQGPFGWESFLSSNQITVDNTGTSDIVAASQYAGSLAVFGEDWATILNGDPDNYREYYLGGAGAQSARAVATYGGQMFALSANTLWRITPPSGLSAPEATDFGQPVQDLLPTAGRLSVSAKKASLYVTDETTGECLRFHFPTQRWFIEDRDALGTGDTSAGFTVIHQSGAYSAENTALAGDDIDSGTTGDATGTINDADSITMSDPSAPVGTRVLVVDSAGTEALTRVVSYAGGLLTVTSGDLSALTGTCSVYLGVGDSGCLVDTGWYPNPTGQEGQALKVNAGVIAGDGWEISTEGKPAPGARTAATSTDYIAIGTDADEEYVGGSRGRWIRTRIRNRHSELGQLDRLEITHDLEQ